MISPLAQLNWVGYLGVVLAAYLIPGPDFLIILRAARRSPGAGLLAAIGAQTGLLVHMVLAAVGVSVLLARHPEMLIIIKAAGGLYLAFLGWSVVRHRGSAVDDQLQSPARHGAYLSGLLTNLLNPKALVFFVSLVPQFLRPEVGPTPVQFLALGIVDVLVGFLPWALVIMVGHRLSTWLNDRHRRRHWDFGTGGLLAAVGAVLTGSSVVEAVRTARG